MDFEGETKARTITLTRRSMELDSLAVDAGMVPGSLFINSLRLRGLSDDHIRSVLLSMIGVCQNCWDKPKPCNCRRKVDPMAFGFP